VTASIRRSGSRSRRATAVVKGLAAKPVDTTDGNVQSWAVDVFDRRWRGNPMATYVLLSSLTPEGGQTLHAHPERLAEVNAEIESFGCRVVSQYALLGLYDFLTVVEAPDNETVAHLSVDLGSRGTVRVTTLPAISIDSLVQKLGDAQQLGHS
jgi:uncharacterized protein with GYD domain